MLSEPNKGRLFSGETQRRHGFVPKASKGEGLDRDRDAMAQIRK
jgi:hypothetical protein